MMARTHPLVSVVMPTRDRPMLLVEAVGSVLRQTYRHFELLVVNDGGTSVAHRLHRPGAPIHLIELPRPVGPAAARHLALTHAHGSLVAYLDDDDLFHEDHLRCLVEALTGPDACSLVYTGADLVQLERRGDAWQVARQAMPIPPFDRRRLLVANYIPLICVGHSLADYHEAGGFDRTLPCLEDWDLLLRLTRERGARHLPWVTAAYRQFQGITRVNALTRQGLEVLQRIYARHPVDPALQRSRQEHLVQRARDLRLVNRLRAGVQQGLSHAADALGQGNATRAARILAEIRARVPDDGEILLALAGARQVLGHHQAALELLAEARRRDPFLAGRGSRSRHRDDDPRHLAGDPA